MSRAFALFVDPSDASAGDAVLSLVFGEPQSDSFRHRLSPTGEEPATALGAMARGLSEAQATILAEQATVATEESTWTDALAARSLVLIPIPEAS